MEERASWRGQGVGVNPHPNSGGLTFSRLRNKSSGLYNFVKQTMYADR